MIFRFLRLATLTLAGLSAAACQAGRGPAPGGPVTDGPALERALQNARGGEVIQIAPGVIPKVYLAGINPGSMVTIRSADPANPATIGELGIRGASNLRFEQIDIGHPLEAGANTKAYYAQVNDVHNVVFDRIAFHGSLDDNPLNDASGLFVRNGDHVTISNSSFVELNRGGVFSLLHDVTITGNIVRSAREGFDFAKVDAVAITGNRFDSVRPDTAQGDHADCIQFWSKGVDAGSEKILIADNVMIVGDSGGTQGIFMRAEVAGTVHKGITIRNNLYYGDARHGITLMGAEDADITGNTIVSTANPLLQPAINIRQAHDIRVHHNVATLILVLPDATADVGDNLVLLRSPRDRLGGGVGMPAVAALDSAPAADFARLGRGKLGFVPPAVEAGSTARWPGACGGRARDAAVRPLLCHLGLKAAS